MKTRGALLLLLPALLGCLAGGGCGPSPGDVRQWLQQEHGAARVAALLADGERPWSLRQEAARVLIGAGAVPELSDALSVLPQPERARLVSELAPGLREALQGQPEAQAQAKEAIWAIGGYAPEPERRALRQALIDWAMADFARRSRQGEHSLAQLLPGLGSEVAVPLLRQLRAGVAVPETVQALLALGQPEVTRATATLLAEQAQRALPELPPPLAGALLAVQAPELTPVLLVAAADPRVKLELRTALLEHVLACKGAAAAPGLARLLSDPVLRWNAARSLLELEGLAGLSRLLVSLPEDAAWPAQDEEFYQSADFFCDQEVGALEARPAQLEQALLDGLTRAGWPGKAIAIRCLSYHGGSGALVDLQRATSLTQRLPGWRPADSTLGQAARQTLAQLQRK